MPIISVRDNEIIDERETPKKKKRQKRTIVNYSERTKAEWFCCAIKLGYGYLKLICKDSLIFKSNLELPLSIIFKKQ